MSWTILLTSPQSEFKVRDELIERGASAVVPVEFRWTRGKAKRIVKQPLLPGYVFAEIENWSTLVQRTTRTIRIGKDDFVHEEGMAHLLDGLRTRPVLMIEGAPARLSPSAVNALLALSRPIQGPRPTVRIGDRLRVKLGHFTDLQADVARITAKGQPVAVVEMFGKRHEVTLEPGQWEAA